MSTGALSGRVGVWHPASTLVTIAVARRGHGLEQVNNAKARDVAALGAVGPT